MLQRLLEVPARLVEPALLEAHRAQGGPRHGDAAGREGADEERREPAAPRAARLLELEGDQRERGLVPPSPLHQRARPEQLPPRDSAHRDERRACPRHGPQRGVRQPQASSQRDHQEEGDEREVPSWSGHLTAGVSHALRGLPRAGACALRPPATTHAHHLRGRADLGGTVPHLSSARGERPRPTAQAPAAAASSARGPIPLLSAEEPPAARLVDGQLVQTAAARHGHLVPFAGTAHAAHLQRVVGRGDVAGVGKDITVEGPNAAARVVNQVGVWITFQLDPHSADRLNPFSVTHDSLVLKGEEVTRLTCELSPDGKPKLMPGDMLLDGSGERASHMSWYVGEDANGTPMLIQAMPTAATGRS
jgi:hypothetical protein